METGFYPRPPRGGRLVTSSLCLYYTTFLSTPSARRATELPRADDSRRAISIHALREEGDTTARPMIKPCSVFLSTPSARRATDAGGHGGLMGGISIHALREEGDLQCLVTWSSHRYFYPRPPRGGRRWYLRPRSVRFRFLSTPSARRATRYHPQNAVFNNHFYPRPPRGGRRRREVALNVCKKISIHALREEGDHAACGCCAGTSRFLSTPSARRATCVKGEKCNGTDHFYPRPPRGGRPDGGDG